MSKLIGGLGFCWMLCSVASVLAQDPFELPYEPPKKDPAPTFLAAPPMQAELPIIQTLPVKKPRVAFNQPTLTQQPLTRRVVNAHVRTPRTPGQESIHNRAVIYAQQRDLRIQQRKWLGQSALRPGHTVQRESWYNGYPASWSVINK